MKKKYIHPMCKGHELKTRHLICGSEELYIKNAAEGGVAAPMMEYDVDDAVASAKGGRSFFDE